MVSILMCINGHYCFNSLCQKKLFICNTKQLFISMYIYSNITMRFPNNDLSSTWTPQCCFKEGNLSRNIKAKNECIACYVVLLCFVSKIQPKRFKMLRYECSDSYFIYLFSDKNSSL